MRSVIEALGTPDIRRVKIGWPAGAKKTSADHVLDRFQPDELPIIEAAVTLASDRILELIS